MLRERFDPECEFCGAELKGIRSNMSFCSCPRAKAKGDPPEPVKKYQGVYSLPEYRAALTEAYPHVRRQLETGLHAQDRRDAAAWLNKWAPFVQALKIKKDGVES